MFSSRLRLRIVAGYHVDASPCCIRSLPVSGISTVMLASPSLDRSLSSLEVSTCSLVRAASLGDCRGVLFLLHKGSLDVNSSDGAFNGETALIASSSRGHAQTVSVLLSVPALDVNSQTAWGGSALMGACCRGHERVVALLLGRRDLDVNARSVKGRTALTFAVAYDRIGVVRLLLSDGRVQSSIAGSMLLPPLEVAVRGGFSHIVSQLVHSSLVTGYRGDLSWLHLLHHAIQQCHLGVVEVLTSFFLSMQVSGGHSVVESGSSMITLRNSILLSMRFGLPSSCSVMKYLLEHWQCDPAEGDSSGMTLLHRAVIASDLSSVSFLLALPAVDVDALSDVGATPFSLAVSMFSYSIVGSFLANGRLNPNIGHCPVLAHTALMPPDVDVPVVFSIRHYAVDGGSMFRLLVDSPIVDVNAQSSLRGSRDCALWVAALYSSGAGLAEFGWPRRALFEQLCCNCSVHRFRPPSDLVVTGFASQSVGEPYCAIFDRAMFALKRQFRARFRGLVRAAIVFIRMRLRAALHVYSPGREGFIAARSRFEDLRCASAF